MSELQYPGDYCPLHQAAWIGDVTEVRELLQTGKFDVNKRDKCNWSALDYACAKGHLSVVRVLISDFNAYVHIRDHKVSLFHPTSTPLHIACREGHVELVRALVSEFNSDVNIKDSSFCTPLHYACRKGHVNVVRALVSEFNADLNVTDLYHTPLHYACKEGHVDVVRALVSEKVDPNYRQFSNSCAP